MWRRPPEPTFQAEFRFLFSKNSQQAWFLATKTSVASAPETDAEGERPELSNGTRGTRDSKKEANLGFAPHLTQNLTYTASPKNHDSMHTRYEDELYPTRDGVVALKYKHSGRGQDTNKEGETTKRLLCPAPKHDSRWRAPTLLLTSLRPLFWTPSSRRYFSGSIIFSSDFVLCLLCVGKSTFKYWLSGAVNSLTKLCGSLQPSDDERKGGSRLILPKYSAIVRARTARNLSQTNITREVFLRAAGGHGIQVVSVPQAKNIESPSV